MRLSNLVKSGYDLAEEDVAKAISLDDLKVWLKLNLVHDGSSWDMALNRVIDEIIQA